MNRREFGRFLGGLAIAPALAPSRLLAEPVLGPPAEARRWSFVADVAECCSCDIPCPCNFGRPVDTCFGNRLIQIRQGDLEGADLAGMNFLVTFQMRRWTRLYLDSSIGAERVATLERFLPIGFAGFAGIARATEHVPLTIEAGEDTFRFSGPHSAVEMTLLKGMDGGPIRVTGLPSTAYYDYVQYESVVHRHESADGSWSYAGTNGFRSVMRASG
jgi:Protein of unknown function (DUF1326)